MLGRSVWLGARGWLIWSELWLEPGTDVDGGAAEEREDSTMGGEGFGDAGAYDACGADNGAVFSCEAESHGGI